MARKDESTLGDPERREYAEYLLSWSESASQKLELPLTWEEWLKIRELGARLVDEHAETLKRLSEE